MIYNHPRMPPTLYKDADPPVLTVLIMQPRLLLTSTEPASAVPYSPTLIYMNMVSHRVRDFRSECTNVDFFFGFFKVYDSPALL